MDFKIEIAKLLAAAADISVEDAAAAVEIPAKKEMGDFAYPCFRLAKVFRKAPPMIANELIEKIEKPDFIAKMEVVGAYINFFVNKGVYAEQVLSAVLEQKENYGKSDMGAGKTVVIDYSSPNAAKQMHIGHIRSTVIGNAIDRIFRALGYEVIADNHLGDWGTQFGILIMGYRECLTQDERDNLSVANLEKCYVLSAAKAKEDESWKDSCRLELVKLQQGDEIIDMAPIEEGATILAITEGGYGKRTSPDEYREQGRNGKGIRAINLTDKTGDLAALLLVHEEEDILLITDDGTIIRTPAADVRLCGRNTQGVRVMRLAEDSKVIGVARAEKEEETDVAEVIAEMNGENPVEAEAATEATAEEAAPEADI